MIQRTIHTNGIRLNVAEAGPVDGKLVILLHGFPEFFFGWRSQIPSLAEAGFHVVAPDQRGYNLSEKPAGISAYGLEQLVADITGLIDAYGHEKAAIVGHDWGGAVAYGLAMQHPQRVQKLVILNSAPDEVMRRRAMRSPRQALKSLYIIFFQIPRLPEWLWSRNGFAAGVRSLQRTSRPGAFTPEDLRQYRQAWSQPGAPTAMLNWYRAARFPFHTKSKRVQAPTLILWGRHDAFLTPELAEDSRKICDQAEVVYFDATHWLQHERAEEVNEALVDWVSG